MADKGALTNSDGEKQLPLRKGRGRKIQVELNVFTPGYDVQITSMVVVARARHPEFEVVE